MKHAASLTAVAVVTLTAGVASAGTPGSVSGSASLVLVPSGEFTIQAAGNSQEYDLETAHGVGVQLDYWITEQISVGLAPRYLVNVIPTIAEPGEDAATELDVALRIQVHHVVNPQMSVFGFFAPGYSEISLPREAGDIDDPTGLVLGFGAGGRIALNDELFAQGELGYQRGYQGGQASDFDVTFATNLLHLGVGLGMHF